METAPGILSFKDRKKDKAIMGKEKKFIRKNFGRKTYLRTNKKKTVTNNVVKGLITYSCRLEGGTGEESIHAGKRLCWILWYHSGGISGEGEGELKKKGENR